MAAAGIKHSQLAAKLIVEGCLAHIAGNVQGRMPVAPTPLSEIERAERGLDQGGNALFYPIDEKGGVGFDLNGATATVWYGDGDFDRGLETLEVAMKNAYRVKQLKDEALPAPKVRRRTYEVDFGNSRLALVVADYAERGAQDQRFIVRIIGQIRKQ
jgi:hypothetical protein